MLVWFLLLGTVLSEPADEFKEIVGNDVGDFSQKIGISNIVPSGIVASNLPTQNLSGEDEWTALVISNSDNKYFKLFDRHVEKGETLRKAKHLTFCIYNDKMRDAAIALFRLFQNTDGETFIRVREWAKKNINSEMYMYALRLESLYSSKINDTTLLPPFVWNPHYFVNAESLAKASIALNDILTEPINQYGNVFSTISNANPSHRMRELVIIKSNYSEWNLHKHGKDYLTNYFREDISLNSYYLGIHLLHPFWMSDEELESMNPRFAEHYYYAHQQLMARYDLEKLHVKEFNLTRKCNRCEYVPYLRHKNGLPFLTRLYPLEEWSNEFIYLKTIDIAVAIGRGIINMKNEERTNKTNDSHINKLAKLVRANVDGIKYAKSLRSIFGYGTNAYPIDEYNPAPSTLHYPETSLKDPAYWLMIRHVLKCFTDFKNTNMEPFDITQYESDEFEIIDSDFSKITTYFDYYQFPVNHALSNFIRNENDWPAFVEVRQKRLKHVEFSLNFTVESNIDEDVIVRIYLGPQCYITNCWTQYNNFFELDTFRYSIKEGETVISWSPETSDRFSFDNFYNTALSKATPATKYSIFRFPENLLIPRGLKDGLNLTLFVMITPNDDDDNYEDDVEETPYTRTFYREVSTELDSKPLGFPFHRQAKGFKDNAFNYKFYNVTIYHKSQVANNRGYFSPHLD